MNSIFTNNFSWLPDTRFDTSSQTPTNGMTNLILSTFILFPITEADSYLVIFLLICTQTHTLPIVIDTHTHTHRVKHTRRGTHKHIYLNINTHKHAHTFLRLINTAIKKQGNIEYKQSTKTRSNFFMDKTTTFISK